MPTLHSGVQAGGGVEVLALCRSVQAGGDGEVPTLHSILGTGR